MIKTGSNNLMEPTLATFVHRWLRKEEFKWIQVIGGFFFFCNMVIFVIFKLFLMESAWLKELLNIFIHFWNIQTFIYFFENEVKIVYYYENLPI